MASLYSFIVLLQPIPAKFLQQLIPKEHQNNCMAIVLGPHGKVYNIKLETYRSDMFFTGGWSQFMVFHDITESNALLVRYEGNMVSLSKCLALMDFREIPSRRKTELNKDQHYHIVRSCRKHHLFPFRSISVRTRHH